MRQLLSAIALLCWCCPAPAQTKGAPAPRKPAVLKEQLVVYQFATDTASIQNPDIEEKLRGAVEDVLRGCPRITVRDNSEWADKAKSPSEMQSLEAEIAVLLTEKCFAPVSGQTRKADDEKVEAFFERVRTDYVAVGKLRRHENRLVDEYELSVRVLHIDTREIVLRLDGLAFSGGEIENSAALRKRIKEALAVSEWPTCAGTDREQQLETLKLYLRLVAQHELFDPGDRAITGVIGYWKKEVPKLYLMYLDEKILFLESAVIGWLNDPEAGEYRATVIRLLDLLTAAQEEFIEQHPNPEKKRQMRNIQQDYIGKRNEQLSIIRKKVEAGHSSLKAAAPPPVNSAAFQKQLAKLLHYLGLSLQFAPTAAERAKYQRHIDECNEIFQSINKLER